MFNYNFRKLNPIWTHSFLLIFLAKNSSDVMPSASISKNFLTLGMKINRVVKTNEAGAERTAFEKSAIFNF